MLLSSLLMRCCEKNITRNESVEETFFFPLDLLLMTFWMLLLLASLVSVKTLVGLAVLLCLYIACFVSPQM